MKARHSSTVQKVINAWVVPGPHPDYHHAWQRKLRKDWPALAKALDELTK